MHRVFSISSFNQSNHYNLFYRPDSSIISSSVFKATEKVGSPCYPFHKLGALISPLMFHWYLHIPFCPATELFLNGSEFWLSPSHSSRFAFPAGEAGCTQQWKRERFFFKYMLQLKKFVGRRYRDWPVQTQNIEASYKAIFDPSLKPTYF